MVWNEHNQRVGSFWKCALILPHQRERNPKIECEFFFGSNGCFGENVWIFCLGILRYTNVNYDKIFDKFNEEVPPSSRKYLIDRKESQQHLNARTYIFLITILQITVKRKSRAQLNHCNHSVKIVRSRKKIRISNMKASENLLSINNIGIWYIYPIIRICPVGRI